MLQYFPLVNWPWGLNHGDNLFFMFVGIALFVFLAIAFIGTSISQAKDTYKPKSAEDIQGGFYLALIMLVMVIPTAIFGLWLLIPLIVGLICLGIYTAIRAFVRTVRFAFLGGPRPEDKSSD